MRRFEPKRTGQSGNKLVECFVRRGVVEYLPRPIVQAVGDEVEVALVEPHEGGSLAGMTKSVRPWKVYGFPTGKDTVLNPLR